MGLSDAHLALVFVDEYDTAGKCFFVPDPHAIFRVCVVRPYRGE